MIATGAPGRHLPRERVRSTALTLSTIVGLGFALLAALASPGSRTRSSTNRTKSLVVLAGALTVPLSRSPRCASRSCRI